MFWLQKPLFLFLTFVLVTTSILGSEQSNVRILSSSNFDRVTKKGTWLVEFYAPWCGHCKRLAPIYEKVANELKGEVHVAKCDATLERGLAARFPVSGYPVGKFIFFPAIDPS